MFVQPADVALDNRYRDYEHATIFLKQHCKKKQSKPSLYLDTLSETKERVMRIVIINTTMFSRDFMSQVGYLKELKRDIGKRNFYFFTDKNYKYKIVYSRDILFITPIIYENSYYPDIIKYTTKNAFLNTTDTIISYCEFAIGQKHNTQEYKKISLDKVFPQLKKIKRNVCYVDKYYSSAKRTSVDEEKMELPDIFSNYLEIIEMINEESKIIVAENVSPFINIRCLTDIIAGYLV